ncbi:hypothetical protein P9112_011639 [Eukaryota sp. TZLM1-RC]
MSQFALSEVSQGRPRPDNALSSLGAKLFSFVQALHDATPKHNMLMIALLVIELLQIVAFVGREMTFHPVFDISPVLHYVLPPLFTDYYEHQVRVVFFLSSILFLSILLAVSFALSHRLTSNLSVSSPILSAVKGLFELTIHVFAFPLASLYFSMLPCGRTRTPSDLTFTEFLSDYDCQSSIAHIYRIGALLSLGVLLALCYVWLLFYDCRFSSRRVFSKSNVKPCALFQLSKLLLLVVFFLFHLRAWLFRLCYLLMALIVASSFYHVLPFYRKQSNLIALAAFGSWAGFSLCYLIYSFLSLFFPATTILTTLMITIVVPIAAVLSLYLGRQKLLKITKWTANVKTAMVNNSVLDEDFNLNEEISVETINLDDLFLSRVRSSLDFEILIKNVPIEDQSLQKALMLIGKYSVGSNVNFLLFSNVFELDVLKDTYLASGTIQTVKNLLTDLDSTLFQKFILFRNSHHLEILRRTQSTGHAVDSSAFLQLQACSKQITNLHKECLVGLYSFWSIFDSDNVELSKLPSILSRVHSLKSMLKTRFEKVFMAHGHETSVLEQYVRFLREVECDEQSAVSVEEQMAMLAHSDCSSSKGGSTTMSFSVREEKKGRKKTARFNQSLLSKSSKKGAIGALKSSVVTALIIMALLALASFLISSNGLSSLAHQFDQLYELSHVDNVAQNIGSLVNQMSMNFEPTSEELTISLNQLLLSESEHISFHVRRLVLSSKDVSNSDVCEFPGSSDLEGPATQIKTLLVDPSYSVVITKDLVPPTTDSEIMSLWAMGMKLGLDAALYAKNSSMYVNEKNINEVLPVFSAACINMFSNLIDLVSNSLSNFLLIQQIVFGSIVCVVIILAFALFGRSFSKISDERGAILNLFLYIPRSEVQRVLQHPKFKGVKKRKSRTRKLSQLNVQDGSEEESSDSDSGFSMNKEEVEDCITMEVEDCEEQSHSVPTKIRLTMILITALIVFSIIFLGNFLTTVENNVDSTNSEYLLAFEVRHAASGMTNIDRILSSHLQLFLTFGDQYYLNKYFELVNSGERTDYLMQINSLDLTSEELSQIAEQATFLNEIRYVERIILQLTSSVFDISEFFSNFVSFDYNSADENNFFQTKLAYPHIDHWYHSPQYDVERLSPSERLIMSRNLVVDSRRLGVFEELMVAIDDSADRIATQRLDIVTSNIADFDFSFRIIFISILVTFIFFGIIGIFLRKYYSKLRFCRFLLTFLFLLAFLGFSIAIYLAFQTIPIAERLQNDGMVSLQLYEPIVSAQYAFNTIRRNFQIVQVSGSYSHTKILFDRIDELETLLATIETDSFCEGTNFVHVCNLTQSMVITIREILDNYLYWGTISTKLCLSAFNDNVYEGFGLSNVTWNISETVDAIKLAESFELTNDIDDMNLEADLKLNLSMAITSSRQFDQMSVDIGDLLEHLRDDSFDEMYKVISSHLNSIWDNFEIIQFSGILVLVLTIVISVLFTAAATPKRKEAAHIKQKIQVPSIRKYTKHYILSLLVLLAILSMFLILSFVSTKTLHDYPKISSLMSRRGALIKAIASDVMLSRTEDFDSHSFQVEASKKVLQLNRLHNEILLESSFDGLQSSLLFETNFIDDSKEIADSDANYGLHAVITGFITMISRYVSGEFSNFDDSFSIILDELFRSSSTSYTMNLQSLQYLRSHYSESLSFLNNLMLVTFVLFVVAVTLIFFVVFKKMLSTLHEEELTTLEFLNMLDEDIVSQVKVIRNYISNS